MGQRVESAAGGVEIPRQVPRRAGRKAFPGGVIGRIISSVCLALGFPPFRNPRKFPRDDCPGFCAPPKPRASDFPGVFVVPASLKSSFGSG